MIKIETEKKPIFKEGDRVVVIRNVPKTKFEKDRSFGGRADYPIIGVTGTLSRKYSFDSGQWIIKWDIDKRAAGNGDLIYEWMIRKIGRRITMKIGDKVFIKSSGYCYKRYEKMAIKMGATFWREGVGAKTGEMGIIKSIQPHLDHPKIEGKLALIEIKSGDFEPKKQVIVAIKGLVKYNSKHIYAGDIIMITKKVEKEKGWRDSWTSEMDTLIGRIGRVQCNEGSYGIRVKVRGTGSVYRFPKTALTKIPRKEVY